MRFFFRALAFLDVIALLLMCTQLWGITERFSTLTKTSEQVSAIGMCIVFFLILAGVVGLLSGKKYGLVLYYVQFPFRLYLWVFTLGFITIIPEALALYDDFWFDMLLKICFVAEIIRLYLTIKGHMEMAKTAKR